MLYFPYITLSIFFASVGLLKMQHHCPLQNDLAEGCAESHSMLL